MLLRAFHTQIAIVMDSLTHTTQSALVRYYNVLRRMGSIRKQDKYKLLVLWFFYYLKNNSDFLYTWDAEQEKFVIDTKLEREVEKKFRCNLDCLLNASCFIKLMASDNCIPIIDNMWTYPDIVERIVAKLFVPNATGIIIGSDIDDDTLKLDIDDTDDLLWTSGSGEFATHTDKLMGESSTIN